MTAPRQDRKPLPRSQRRLLGTPLLVALDGLGLILAAWFSLRIRLDPASLELKIRELYARPEMILLSVLMAYLAAVLAGLYRPPDFATRTQSALHSAGAAACALLGLVLLQTLSEGWRPGRGIVLASFTLWAFWLHWVRRVAIRWGPVPTALGTVWICSLDLYVLSRLRPLGRLVAKAWTAGDTAREPAVLSSRVVDGATAIFALWTMTCHAVVSFGGVFQNLLSAWAMVLLGAVCGWRAIRRSQNPGTPATQPPPSPISVSEPRLFMARRIGFLLAGVALVVVALSEDWIIRWLAVFVVLLFGLGSQLLFEDRGFPPQPEPAVRSLGSERWLWCLSMLSVILSLVAHRPDLDDSLYVNFAVSALDLPQWQLLRSDVLHGIPELPLHLSLYQLHSIELGNALLAWLTGLTAIQTFHWLSTAMAAALVPLVGAKLFRSLVPGLWPWATSFYVLILFTIGDSHRWYGNFAFVRIWQGKGVLLFIFLPLVWVYGMALARRLSLRNWLWLAAAMIAAVGSSATALWVAPTTALMAMVVERRPSFRTAGLLLLGVSSSFYMIAAGLLMKSEVTQLLSARKPRLPGDEFVEAVTIVLGDSRLFLATMLVLLVAWIVAPNRKARRFAVVSCTAVWGVLLNPFLSSWMVSYVTGAAYWRAFWALPLPVLMTLVLVAPLSWKWPTPFWTRAGLSLSAASLLTLWVPSVQILSTVNRVEFHVLPELKVATAYEQALRLNELAPPHSVVVASTNVSAWVTTFHQHVYPVAVRHYLRSGRSGRLDMEEIREREAMSAYAGGADGFLGPEGKVIGKVKQAELFAQGLDHHQVSAVCLHIEDHRDLAHARQILEEQGFQRNASRIHYEIWLRATSGQD